MRCHKMCVGQRQIGASLLALTFVATILTLSRSQSVDDVNNVVLPVVGEIRNETGIGRTDSDHPHSVAPLRPNPVLLNKPYKRSKILSYDDKVKRFNMALQNLPEGRRTAGQQMQLIDVPQRRRNPFAEEAVIVDQFQAAEEHRGFSKFPHSHLHQAGSGSTEDFFTRQLIGENDVLASVDDRPGPAHFINHLMRLTTAERVEDQIPMMQRRPTPEVAWSPDQLARLDHASGQTTPEVDFRVVVGQNGYSTDWRHLTTNRGENEREKSVGGKSVGLEMSENNTAVGISSKEGVDYEDEESADADARQSADEYENYEYQTTSEDLNDESADEVQVIRNNRKRTLRPVQKKKKAKRPAEPVEDLVESIPDPRGRARRKKKIASKPLRRNTGNGNSARRPTEPSSATGVAEYSATTVHLPTVTYPEIIDFGEPPSQPQQQFQNHEQQVEFVQREQVQKTPPPPHHQHHHLHHQHQQQQQQPQLQRNQQQQQHSFPIRQTSVYDLHPDHARLPFFDPLLTSFDPNDFGGINGQFDNLDRQHHFPEEFHQYHHYHLQPPQFGRAHLTAGGAFGEAASHQGSSGPSQAVDQYGQPSGDYIPVSHLSEAFDGRSSFPPPPSPQQSNDLYVTPAESTGLTAPPKTGSPTRRQTSSPAQHGGGNSVKGNKGPTKKRKGRKPVHVAEDEDGGDVENEIKPILPVKKRTRGGSTGTANDKRRKPVKKNKKKKAKDVRERMMETGEEADTVSGGDEDTVLVSGEQYDWSQIETGFEEDQDDEDVEKKTSENPGETAVEADDDEEQQSEGQEDESDAENDDDNAVADEEGNASDYDGDKEEESENEPSSRSIRRKKLTTTTQAVEMTTAYRLPSPEARASLKAAHGEPQVDDKVARVETEPLSEGQQPTQTSAVPALHVTDEWSTRFQPASAFGASWTAVAEGENLAVETTTPALIANVIGRTSR